MFLEEKCIVVFLHNRPFFGAHLVHAPFLVMLRQQYPNAKLVGVTKNNSASLLIDAGFLDCLEIVEKKEQFRLLRKYNFDIGFNLRPSSIGVAFQMLLLKIPHRVGFKKFGALYSKSFPLDIDIYRADLFLKMLDLKSSTSAVPYLKENIIYNNEFSEGILLVPGAGGEEKKWPIESYILLANKFIESGEGNVFFITGPKEMKEKELLENKGFKVFSSPDLKVLFSLVNSCKIFISNDCGPSHVAHIFGVNQVVLFNKFLPEWFLKRENSRYLSSLSGVSSISVEEVMKTAMSIINRGC
jgi:ADP-heptose:LPS heptosyltransferase